MDEARPERIDPLAMNEKPSRQNQSTVRNKLALHRVESKIKDSTALEAESARNDE